MCLIIYKTTNDKLTDDFLGDVWKKNSDGWGILYNDRETGEPVAVKGLDFLGFLREYDALNTADMDFVIHMRMATHGGVSRKNCHPYKVIDGLYLMHNGIVTITQEKKDDHLSDTRVFIRDVLRPMLMSVPDPFEFIKTYAFQHMMDFYAEGQDSRFVLYSKEGPLFFGTWKETTSGVYVSNHYAFTLDNPTYVNGVKKTSYGGGWYGREDDDYYKSWPSSSSTPVVIGKKEESVGDVSTKHVASETLDSRVKNSFAPTKEEVEDDYANYVSSLSDATENFQVVAEHYWELGDDEIKYAGEKIASGEWYFEIDDVNPNHSGLFDADWNWILPEDVTYFMAIDEKYFQTVSEAA